jgi:tetratricopeptide (TPR) repeat protein
MRVSRFRPAAVVALACALSAAAGADERWLEVRSPHFRVLTDATEKDGRALIDGFEQLRKLVLSLGEMRVDPPVPIVIVAARNQASLRSLVPFSRRRGGTSVAGAFLGGTDKHYIALHLDVSQDRRDDIAYHEYVHLLVRLNFTTLPVWLNEGLAEFYARTAVRGDQVVYGRVNAWRVRQFHRRAPLPLEDLFAIDYGSPEYNERSRVTVFYAQSGLLTHYFLVADNGAHRRRLTDYMALLAQGAPDAEARARAFGDLRALEKAFFAYARQDEFTALIAPLQRTDATATARPLSAAEVLALRGDLQARFAYAEDARQLLNRARALDPGLAAVPQALGLLESRAGRPAEARRLHEEAIRLEPNDFASHYLWAQAMPGDAPDLPATEAAVRRAIQLNPSFAPAHALLSAVQRRGGQRDSALLSIEKACQLEPTRSAYWVQRADLLREMKRPDLAEEIESRVARLAPSEPEQLRSLADYYRADNRLDELERLLRKAAELNPRSSVAPLMLARLLREMVRPDDAEAAFRSALAAQPGNPSILNALAYFNADRGVKVAEALELADRALRLVPENANILDTKGWVLFRLGRLDEAERILRESLRQREDADVLEHLGDVLAARGQKAAAQETWRRALDHPDVAEERVAELRRKLGG